MSSAGSAFCLEVRKRKIRHFVAAIVIDVQGHWNREGGSPGNGIRERHRFSRNICWLSIVLCCLIRVRTAMIMPGGLNNNIDTLPAILPFPAINNVCNHFDARPLRAELGSLRGYGTFRSNSNSNNSRCIMGLWLVMWRPLPNTAMAPGANDTPEERCSPPMACPAAS